MYVKFTFKMKTVTKRHVFSMRKGKLFLQYHVLKAKIFVCLLVKYSMSIQNVWWLILVVENIFHHQWNRINYTKLVYNPLSSSQLKLQNIKQVFKYSIKLEDSTEMIHVVLQTIVILILFWMIYTKLKLDLSLTVLILMLI